MRQNIYAVLAAMIWGMAFVAQSVGSQSLDALSFTAIRFAIAAFFLFLLCRYRNRGKNFKITNDLFNASLINGLISSVSMVCQQIGIANTSSGKAAFITALYILIVPIIEFFLYKRFKLKLCFSLILASIGLYFLCVSSAIIIGFSDISLFICSFLCAVQIMCIDYYVNKVDGIEMACGQMIISSVICLFGMLFFGNVEFRNVIDAIPALLYSGAISGGIAYILQIKAQTGSDPSMISLLFSLESVFASLFGAIFLKQIMTAREFTGCIIIMIAIIISIIDFKKVKKND